MKQNSWKINLTKLTQEEIENWKVFDLQKWNLLLKTFPQKHINT